MDDRRESEPAPRYPVESRSGNTLWSISAFFFGALVLANVVLLAFTVRDPPGIEVLSILGFLLSSALLFLLVVDRTTWSPSWITTFLDWFLRRQASPRS